MDIHDVFGLKPIGQAGLQITQASIDGVKSFLNAVCKPGLEELGFILKDRVRQWRLNNLLRVLDKAKGKICFDGQELNLCANPRVGISIMEGCSEVDNDDLQDLWAGLFVSSCTPDGYDDSNMIFVDLLRRMSSIEARLIDYACRNCKKSLFPNTLITAEGFTVSFNVLSSITGVSDLYRLDSELDHMRSIELLVNGGLFSPGGGFTASDENLDANLTPTPLALNLFYKTHSIGSSPVEFWGDSLIPFSFKDN